MPERDQRLRRPDVRERTRRDIRRLGRREPAGRFWQSLALLGSVGWPIVLFSTGGALLGRYLDARFDAGVRLTLTLLTLGSVVGSFIAYRSLRGGGP